MLLLSATTTSPVMPALSSASRACVTTATMFSSSLRQGITTETTYSSCASESAACGEREGIVALMVLALVNERTMGPAPAAQGRRDRRKPSPRGRMGAQGRARPSAYDVEDGARLARIRSRDDRRDGRRARDGRDAHLPGLAQPQPGPRGRSGVQAAPGVLRPAPRAAASDAARPAATSITPPRAARQVRNRPGRTCSSTRTTPRSPSSQTRPIANRMPSVWIERTGSQSPSCSSSCRRPRRPRVRATPERASPTAQSSGHAGSSAAPRPRTIQPTGTTLTETVPRASTVRARRRSVVSSRPSAPKHSASAT